MNIKILKDKSNDEEKFEILFPLFKIKILKIKRSYNKQENYVNNKGNSDDISEYFEYFAVAWKKNKIKDI